MTELFVQFRQLFGFTQVQITETFRFKLQRHLIDGTVNSVWIRNVFGLLRVRFRQVSLS